MPRQYKVGIIKFRTALALSVSTTAMAFASVQAQETPATIFGNEKYGLDTWSENPSLPRKFGSEPQPLPWGTPSAYIDNRSKKPAPPPTMPGASDTPVFTDDAPVLLEATEVEYQQEVSKAIASGNVAITQGETIVLADKLEYDQKNNTVFASGNVSMLEPSGNVYFADRLELKDNLKAGAIRGFKAKMVDGSKFAAARGRKIDDSKLELFKAVYSPCNVKCAKPGEPSSSPLWQVAADHVLVDDEAQKVMYDNAFVEVHGVPVFYTPYFSHPTPNAENQSGLLTPEFQHSSNIGNVYKVPVYYVIGQDKDITLTPMLTDQEGLVMGGQYRQKLDNGDFEFKGSITRPQERDPSGSRTYGNAFRGHLDGKGTFLLGNNSGWGFDVRRTTDDTYLRRYNFSKDTLLTSKVYAETFNLPGTNNRSYAGIKALAFQGLTAQDNQDRIPFILPTADFALESNPWLYNSRFSLDGNMLALFRDIGAQSRRLSTTFGWKLPYISDDGQVIEFSTRLRTDIYSVSDMRLSNGNLYDGVTGRIVPEASLLWRYPFINRWESGNLLLEPIVNVTLSPPGGNPEKIPNEDSLVPEFTDSNLFSYNRYAGYDRIESGPRISYGLRGQAQLLEDKYFDWMFGQHYRQNTDRTFPFSNELGSHFSDYVGKVGLTYDPFSIAYRFRLDKETLHQKRKEVDGNFIYYPFNANITYLSLSNDPIFSSKEEVSGAASINLTKQWVWNVSGRQDLLIDQVTSVGTGLMFFNECANLIAQVGKEYTRDRDVKPATTFLFRVSLRNLE